MIPAHGFALADKNDKYHDVALQFRDQIAGKVKLITSDYVLDELYTLLLINIDRRIYFRNQMDKAKTCKKAWNIFEKFNTDKKWSFTDCTSYAIMKEKRIKEVFGFDHHFEQMGFLRRP